MIAAFMVILFWVSIIFILYTYFGYPLLIAVLARLAPKTKPYPETYPSVTFLIAAYNEEKVIAEKIENTLALDYPREKLQIIVAADGTTDQTPEIVKKFSNLGVELSYIPARGGKMAAVVRAMSLARGEIIIFSDANNMYDAKAVKLLVAPFSDNKVGAATGAKLVVEDGRNLSSAEGLYWKYESAIKKNETAFSTCTASVGEIMAIRREDFVAPQANIINDDRYMIFELIHRGYNIVYVPEARSYEYVSQTAKDEVTRRSRMNAGAYQTIAMSGKLLPFNRPWVLWQIISHKYFRTFIPYAMVLALISNIIIVIAQNNNSGQVSPLMPQPFGGILLLLQILFYGMALLGNLFKFKGVVGKILYLPTFLVNSNFAAVAGLYSFLTNKRSHIWKRVQR
jgi:poly-beta-1,6-N-acetyl-D-glucosamine synthase